MQATRSLDQIAMLSGLAAEDLARLAKECRWRSFAKGSEVMAASAGDRDVFFLTKGRIRVTIVSHGGREVSFRDLDAGASFGELAAIDGKGRSATAVALEDSAVASLRSDQFWALLQCHPLVADHVLRGFAALIRDLSSRIVELTTLTAPVRVRTELIRMAREAGVSGNAATIHRLPIHADFASHIGATREAVTRELNRLTRAGLIKRHGKGVMIIDVAALTESVADDLAE